MQWDSEIAIGELSRRTECNIETIRYYERVGLLPRPRRTGRYRRYGSEDVSRLRFIRRARQLGFALEEVRALLRFAAAGDSHTRVEVRNLAAVHIAGIRAKIADLRAMEEVLSAAVCECDADRQRPQCPLIEALSGELPGALGAPTTRGPDKPRQQAENPAGLPI